MLGLLASRGLGVVRQTIFNALFGTGLEANAYYAAFRLPDTLFNLIAGGALISALVPVFLSYEKDRGEHEAWRLTSLVFNVSLVALTVVVIIGEFLAPTFVSKILVPGYSPPEQALTSTLTRIMLIQPLILGLGTIATAVLNSKRQFLLPAVSIAVYNFGVIGGLLVTLAVPKVGIYGPTFGVLVAVALTVIVQIPPLIKQGVRYEFIWNLRHPGLHQVLRLLIPNSLAVGIAYMGNIVDTRFTSYLPDSASLSALHNAEMIQALPVALLAQAIGQALLPHLTVQAASGRYVRMRQTALKVMVASILLTVPISLVLVVIGKPLIHLIFQHGAFNQHSTDLTSLALIGYAVALPAMVAANLIAGGFFALKDAVTPFLSNTLGLLTRYGLLVLFFQVLAGKGAIIILAVPLALTGGVICETIFTSVMLLWRLQRRIKTDKGMQRLLRRRMAAQEEPDRSR
ncbi:MAG: murein biosynthesis integral membrane protein MurJ [Chloroflexi bacterium]|nr:murein biosynthesis integral membrane protein MurJ [Chloroflexota bacterium]